MATNSDYRHIVQRHRWINSLVLATLSLAAIGLTATTADAATIVSQAQAQAVNISLLGGAQTIAASNPPTSATSDGTASSVNQNTPAATGLSGQSWLSVGSLSELAAAYATGTSFGCAGVLQPGGTLRVGNGGNCTSTAGTGSGLDLNLSQLPGVGSALSGIASVSVQISSLIAYAEANGPSAIGSVELGTGQADVSVAGGLTNVDVPINLSNAPNENLLTEITAGLSAQNNSLLSGTIDAFSSAVSPALQLITNYQTTTSSGALKVTALHASVAGSQGLTADLATAWAGPNTSTSTTSTSAPSVTGITPTSGPSSGGTFVTITGSNLNGATGVTFGGVPANFIPNADGTITVISPAGTGTVDVQVKNSLGTSPATTAGRFTYVLGNSSVPGSASAASGTANATGLCPAGEVPTGYVYTLPLTLKVTDTSISAGTPVFGRIVEGNRIVVSTKTNLSRVHAATVTDIAKTDGQLTGELVLDKRVVEKIAVPLSAPSQCKAKGAAKGTTMTYIARLTQFKIGSKLPGGIYLDNNLIQSFNVQIRANHVVTFVDHTPQAGAVAKIFAPGKAHVVLVTVKGVTS